jgi:type IV pilus assembly protein PilA
MTTSAQRQRGQGMTEYIIIVALIAIAAIGIYQAFGDVVRGQSAVAVSTLAGETSDTARQGVEEANDRANSEGDRRATLANFEQASAQ